MDFGNAIREPIEAVIWNSIDNDREAKKAILRRILGVNIDENAIVE